MRPEKQIVENKLRIIIFFLIIIKFIALLCHETSLKKPMKSPRGFKSPRGQIGIFNDVL